MSSGEETEPDDGRSTTGSPYDEPTEIVDRPKIRRPQPDNDEFFDRHGRRPSPSVRDAIADKAESDAQADADVVDDESDTVAFAAARDGNEGPEGSGSDGVVDGDAKTSVIIDPGAETSALHPVRKSVSSDPVRTEPFADDDRVGDESVRGRRFAEQMTEAPLPYIEPQPTAEMEVPGAYDDEPLARGELDDDRPTDVVDIPEAAAPPARRGTLDLGLLVLRVVVGLTFTLHGLQKLTGWMNGPGPDGFADFLANPTNPSLGFNGDATTILSFVASVSETAGGILLILGLLTPIAGAAVLSSILVAITYRVTLADGLWFFAGDGDGNGVELEVILAAAAATLILTGPGTYAIDRRWGWSRRPAWGSAGWLIIGIGAAVAVWVIFNGANPLA